jgi:phage terminase large subunit-like protein
MASRRSKQPVPWWGDDGPAPHLEWSGVSIEIPAVWRSQALRWESPDGRYYFDRASADKAADFYPTFLRHHIGAFAGQAFTLLPYQAKLLTRPLFGWKRAIDGLRRFGSVFFWGPKGSGKSPWESGAGLYVTFFDDEPAAEVYALAKDKDQARVVFGDAQVMLELAPELAERCEVLRDSIYIPSTRSTFKVLSADASGHHGWRPHAVLIDEIQEQRSRDQLEIAKQSMTKRRQPILLMAGHAGTDQESIAYEQYQYAKGVIAGTLVDEQLLPVVFEATDTDDWQSEDTWRRVNPGYGITVQPRVIAQQALEATNEPRKLADFRRYQLNQWTNQASAWIPLEWWKACEVTELDAATFAACDAAGGLDMAQVIDYAAFTVTVRVPLRSGEEVTTTEITDETGTTIEQPLDYSVAVFSWFWLPEERMREREREDGLPLSLYKTRGQLFTSTGATISADQVYRDISTRILPLFPRLRTIGFDPAFASDVSQRLSAVKDVLEVPQNFNQMSVPCYTLEGLLKARRVAHDGHPILRWNVSNVGVKRDEAGRLRPVKPSVVGQHRKRIDGLVALLMGLSVLARQQPAAEPSYQIYVFGGRGR